MPHAKAQMSTIAPVSAISKRGPDGRPGNFDAKGGDAAVKGTGEGAGRLGTG